MFDIVASKGLGDAVMLRALALHLRRNEWDVTVYTGWPDAFMGLDVTVKKDRTGEEDIRHCKACLHCRLPEVRMGSLFEMACRQAGVFDRVPLVMDWVPQNRALMRNILEAADGRQIFLYQPPKIAIGIESQEMQPNAKAFAEYVASHDKYFRVRIGSLRHVVDIDTPHELDLLGKTSVADCFDVATLASIVFSDVSYLQIVGQAMDKTTACMFTWRSTKSTHARVRNMTPSMLFHKPGIAVYDE